MHVSSVLYRSHALSCSNTLHVMTSMNRKLPASVRTRSHCNLFHMISRFSSTIKSPGLLLLWWWSRMPCDLIDPLIASVSSLVLVSLNDCMFHHYYTLIILSDNLIVQILSWKYNPIMAIVIARTSIERIYQISTKTVGISCGQHHSDSRSEMSDFQQIQALNHQDCLCFTSALARTCLLIQ